MGKVAPCLSPFASGIPRRAEIIASPKIPDYIIVASSVIASPLFKVKYKLGREIKKSII
jgi:hypothetical protein